MPKLTPPQKPAGARSQLWEAPFELAEWDEDEKAYWAEQRVRCLKASQAQYPDPVPRF